MGQLTAIWGSVLQDVKTTARNVLNAAGTAAQLGVTQIRTDAGAAIQQTGLGAGAAVAPPNTAPTITAALAEHWPVVVVILVILIVGRR